MDEWQLVYVRASPFESGRTFSGVSLKGKDLSNRPSPAVADIPYAVCKHYLLGTNLQYISIALPYEKRSILITFS